MPDPAAPVRAGRRPTLVALAAVVATAVVAVVLLLPRPAPPPRPAVVDGSAGTRAELVAALRGGGAAGIAAWLVTHPSPPSLRAATRFTTVEEHGQGTVRVRLDAQGVGDGPGRATVLLVLADDGSATWTALDARGATVAVEGGRQRAGALTAATIRYARGGRPVLLGIDAPAGAAWGAAVVFSD